MEARQQIIVKLAAVAVLGIFVSTLTVPPCAAAGPGNSGDVFQDLLETGEQAFAKRDFATADKCFRAALERAEKVSKTDKRVARALSDMALNAAFGQDNAVSKKARLDKAIALEKRSLEIREMAFGPDSANVAGSLQNLSAYYGMADMPKDGEAALRRSIKIQEAQHPPAKMPLGIAYDSLAEMLKKQKREIDALDAYKHAAQIFKDDNRAVQRARVLYAQADLLEEQGNYKEASGIVAEVLKLREQNNGKDSLMVAESLHNLAVCDMKLGKNADALPLLNRALVIVRKNNDKEITATVEATLKKCQNAVKAGGGK